MSAFNDAFTVLKTTYTFDSLINSMLRKGQEDDAAKMNEMRQFVMENENSPDPEKRQAAEEMYEHLTRLMSHLGGNRSLGKMPPAPSMEGAPSPVGEGGSIGEVEEPTRHPMAKAWSSLKKNVIGQQDGTQYNMPPAVASMAQRPQQWDMQGNQNPWEAGANIASGPHVGGQGVQQNPDNPMGGFGAGQDNNATAMGGMGAGAAPGAQVTRMPRPGPFRSTSARDPMGHTDTFQPSFSGQGYSTNDKGQMVTNSKYQNRRDPVGQQFRNEPVGKQGAWMSDNKAPQGSYGDQFAPNIDFNKLN